MIRDKIVFSKNKKDLSLKKCTEICQTYKQTTRGLAEINKGPVNKIDKIDINSNEDSREKFLDCCVCISILAIIVKRKIILQ